MTELSHKKWKLQSLQRFDFHMIAYFQTWLISWKVLLAQLVNETSETDFVAILSNLHLSTLVAIIFLL